MSCVEMESVLTPMGRGAPKIKLQEHSNALNLLCFYSC